MNTSTPSNVVSLFSKTSAAVAVTTAAVDYAPVRQEARENGLSTPNWNVPTCKREDIGLTLHAQLDAKGVFYTVDGRDNFVQNNAGEFVSTGSKTIYNETNEKTLGVMSKGYEIVQNENIFTSLFAEIERAGLDVSNAFTRVRMDNDGQRVMAEIIFPETSFDVAVGDTVALSITAINSFDGSGAFHLKMGAFRFICANGMVSANGIIEYKHQHSKGLSASSAAKHIANGMTQYNEDKESLLEQANTQVNAQDVYEALAIMNKIDTKLAPTYEQYQLVIRPTLKREPAIERHMGLWNKYKAELGNTQWALNNVLTHISTHGDKPEYTADQNITTRSGKEKLVGVALRNMLAA